jgi:hypothetical protein
MAALKEEEADLWLSPRVSTIELLPERGVLQLPIAGGSLPAVLLLRFPPVSVLQTFGRGCHKSLMVRESRARGQSIPSRADSRGHDRVDGT